MSQPIELSDESAALLKRQADAQGLTVDAWVQALAREKARMDDVYSGRPKAQAAAARILEIQKRVKPDPDSDPGGDASDENTPATMSLQDSAKDETSEAAPTVQEIRAAAAKKTP